MLSSAAKGTHGMTDDDRPETLRNIVIFLDIDGVLQPPSKQTRFEHDPDELRRSLADKYDDATYLSMDKYDLGAVYHDWDHDAVELLRTLCADFRASIVISSDWRRSNSLRWLRALFRLHDLHHYVTDATKQLDGPPHYRASEVKEYLDSHPEIERFVIIDDGYGHEFGELFPEQFVHTWSRFEAHDEQRARQILSGLPAQPNPPWPPPPPEWPRR